MKQKKIYVLLLLVCSLVFSSTLLEAQTDADNYGKLVGQIIDPETNKPVNEIFFVSINDSKTLQIEPFGVYTDKKGYFSTKVKEGSYLLYFYPKSKRSIYCWDKNPFKKNGEKRIVLIERGKVTKIIKKAQLVGQLKLVLFSKEGKRINPLEVVGSSVSCHVTLTADHLLRDLSGDEFSDGDNFNDGEMKINSLCSGLYNIKINYKGLGIGSSIIKGIIINSKEMFELNVVIDLTDQTGVEGKVLNQDGSPIEGVEVNVSGPGGAEDKISASVITNNMGYYQIVGLTEGIYIMYFKKRIGDYKYLRIRAKKVVIKKNVISNFDIQR
jgi:hypothetical protein